MSENLADLVRSVRFPMARGRGPAYSAREVDDHLDRILARLEAGQGIDDLLTPTFPPSSRPGAGYDAADVDAFIARLGGRPASSFQPMQPLPEEPGLLGRLLGRR